MNQIKTKRIIFPVMNSSFRSLVTEIILIGADFETAVVTSWCLLMIHLYHLSHRFASMCAFVLAL